MGMSEMKEVIRISVRNLVEFILRSGNLDNRRTVSADREAMRKGSKAHRKIQKQMGLSYRAEVPLLWEEEFDEFVVRLEGRADGIIEEKDGVTIDEIKGVYRDLEFWKSLCRFIGHRLCVMLIFTEPRRDWSR